MDVFGIWLSTFGVIFAIVDPFGYVPVFLSMTAKDNEVTRKKMLLRACIAAFIVLSVSAVIGGPVLHLLGISVPALQISGGMLLLVISFEMLKVLPVSEKLTPHEENEGIKKEDISIIPLAIPMLSGPASIATVIVLTSKAESRLIYPAIVVSSFVTLSFTYWILRFASPILKVIGVTGLNVMTRIMGLLLCAMGVQFIINGYLAVVTRG